MATDPTAPPHATAPTGRARRGPLGRLVDRLTSSALEMEARDLREDSRDRGAMPVRQCSVGQRVVVSGSIRAMTLRPVGGVPALEAELYDGSGTIKLVWLGRRRIQGIEPGRTPVGDRPGHPPGRGPGHLQPVLRAARVSHPEPAPNFQVRPDAAASPDAARPGTDRVADLVERWELREAIGGARGVVDSALASTVFLLAYLLDGKRLTPALVAAVATTVLLLAVRLVRHEPVRQALTGVVVVAVSAAVAAVTGRAANFFVVGIAIQVRTRSAT